MNELTIFNFQENQVRTTQHEGKPYFCLLDLCKILELKQVCKVTKRLNPEGVINNHLLDSVGKKRLSAFISEQNLYKVLLQSRKKEAEKFQDWVTGEVLPQIRATGSYSPELPQSFSQALQLAADQAKQIETQSKQIEEQTPKVEFYDHVVSSSDLIDMAEVAKILAVKGHGRNNLFKFLINKGVLQRYSNNPYQKYIEAGWFKLVESKWTHPKSRETMITLKTMVYQKGLDGIKKLLDADILTDLK